jgi:hypothetical protein
MPYYTLPGPESRASADAVGIKCRRLAFDAAQKEKVLHGLAGSEPENKKAVKKS